MGSGVFPLGGHEPEVEGSLRHFNHLEVNGMRFMRLTPSVIALACFAATSAQAGQRGPHPAVHAHAAAPVHAAEHAGRPNPVPVPQRIANNPALVARLQPLVPSGMTLANAAAGFRNRGQFIAALHVSRNLNIPFAQLKAEMTGSDRDSLGRAIHDLRPAVNAKAAVKTAREEARADLKVSHSTKADLDDKKDDDR